MARGGEGLFIEQTNTSPTIISIGFKDSCYMCQLRPLSVHTLLDFELAQYDVIFAKPPSL